VSPLLLLSPVKNHSKLLAKQYWLSCITVAHHPCHHLTILPVPARNMKGMHTDKFNSEVVPLSDEGVTDVVTYRSCLRTLQAVVEDKTNFVLSKVLGASPADISSLESMLPWSVCITCPVVFQSLSAPEHYKAHITSGVSDVCLECGVASHSVEHLFNCQSHPMQLTVQDLWDLATFSSTLCAL